MLHVQLLLCLTLLACEDWSGSCGSWGVVSMLKLMLSYMLSSTCMFLCKARPFFIGTLGLFSAGLLCEEVFSRYTVDDL